MFGGNKLNKKSRNRSSNINRFIGLVFCTLCISVLSGCSLSVQNLTNREVDEVARYVADKLLQYDENYTSKELVYIDPLLTTAEPITTEEPIATKEPTDAVATTVPQEGTIEDVGIDLLEDNEEEAEWSDYCTTDQWVISYTSFRTYEAYPNNNDIFTIEASEGNQLLVLQFDVKNISNQKIKLNLMDEGYKYKLILGDRNYTPMLSILEDGGLLFLD